MGRKAKTGFSGSGTSKSTGQLPDIHRARTLPAGPGKLTKVTAAFNKHNTKSVFNKRNATLEVFSHCFNVYCLNLNRKLRFWQRLAMLLYG